MSETPLIPGGIEEGQVGNFIATDMSGANEPMIKLINHYWEKGTPLVFRMRRYPMPEKGETFLFPARFAKEFINSHAAGRLSVHGMRAQAEPVQQVPEGMVMVTAEEAAMLAALKEEAAEEAAAQPKKSSRTTTKKE
jgi:hypothetical protein